MHRLHPRHRDARQLLNAEAPLRTGRSQGLVQRAPWRDARLAADGRSDAVHVGVRLCPALHQAGCAQLCTKLDDEMPRKWFDYCQGGVPWMPPWPPPQEHETLLGLFHKQAGIRSTMRLVKHPNVLQLFEVRASKSKIYFVLEYAKGGVLFNKIAKGGKLSEDAARRYFHQLISAVDYCHSRGVYHHDLKPENLLLDENENLKVSDFGLSALAESKRQDGLLHTSCGTPIYVAPEVLSRKGYDGAKADIWSCGVILFVLVVAHNAVNQALVATSLGLGTEYFRILLQSNCGASVLDFTPQTGGGPPSVCLNRLNQNPNSPVAAGSSGGRKTSNRIILAYQGATQNSPEISLAGMGYAPLTMLGIIQSQKTAELLLDPKVNSIFCSPQVKAVDTATTICEVQEAADCLGADSVPRYVEMKKLLELGIDDVFQTKQKSVGEIVQSGWLGSMEYRTLEGLWAQSKDAWQALLNELPHETTSDGVHGMSQDWFTGRNFSSQLV